MTTQEKQTRVMCVCACFGGVASIRVLTKTEKALKPSSSLVLSVWTRRPPGFPEAPPPPPPDAVFPLPPLHLDPRLPPTTAAAGPQQR